MELCSPKDDSKLLETIINSVQSYTSDFRYSIKNVSQMTPDDRERCFVYISKYFNGLFEIQYVDVIIGTVYLHSTEHLEDNIKDYEVILCDRYYYEAIKKESPMIDNHIVFIRINSIFDKHGVAFLNKHSEKYYHFHQINDNNFSVFIKGEQRNYLFDIFPKIQLRSITDLLKDYSYVNLPDGALIDGIFYQKETDWCIYEDMLSYCIQRKFLELSACKHIYLGHRITLTSQLFYYPNNINEEAKDKFE
ncbi:MAG TPA: hypothetical protein DIW17_17135 [Clostridiales bacterium]|jgi:hypothetical protein|nr:hypothetical protein [Clostridiales bacterium]